MAEDAKDRAGMVALMAAVLQSRIGLEDIDPAFAVREARGLITAAYAAEGLPSPFPAASTDTENSNNG